MLRIEKENDTLVRLELDGQLDATEMKLGLDQLIEVTEGMRNGKMLYLIKNFEIPTLGAIMVEFGKLPSLFRMLSAFDKAAVLSDAAWMRQMAEWEGMFIPGLEIKAFGESNEMEARTWLKS